MGKRGGPKSDELVGSEVRARRSSTSSLFSPTTLSLHPSPRRPRCVRLVQVLAELCKKEAKTKVRGNLLDAD